MTARAAVKRLDFFIVGTQKGGTTALSAKLARHPAICCAKPKELHVFDDERRDWTSGDIPDLSAHFPAASDPRLWGEATPIYMYWPQAIERVARYNPEAKIIVSLRHPAYRALSHWKMEFVRRTEELSFAEAISERGRARVRAAPQVFSYVERGFYAPQIARLLAHFPRQNIFFCRMEDLYQDEAAVLQALSGFLDADGAFPDDLGPKRVVPVETSGLAVDATAELSWLSSLFHDDIRETARLTGLDLGAWTDGTYDETYLTQDLPMAPKRVFSA